MKMRRWQSVWKEDNKNYRIFICTIEENPKEWFKDVWEVKQEKVSIDDLYFVFEDDIELADDF